MGTSKKVDGGKAAFFFFFLEGTEVEKLKYGGVSIIDWLLRIFKGIWRLMLCRRIGRWPVSSWS